jgi:hypothetical protein
MRASNGAKMAPKNALFLRVKIKRIHCKKQGLGGGRSIIRYAPNLSFIFFVKKLFFHNQAFRLDRKLIFQV